LINYFQPFPLLSVVNSQSLVLPFTHMCANALDDVRPNALATHSPGTRHALAIHSPIIPRAASVTPLTRVHSSARSHTHPPFYPILWQERDQNVIWRGEIVERQVIRTIMNIK